MHCDRSDHVSIDRHSTDRDMVVEALKTLADAVSALAPADPHGALVCAKMRELRSILDRWVEES